MYRWCEAAIEQRIGQKPASTGSFSLLGADSMMVEEDWGCLGVCVPQQVGEGVRVFCTGTPAYPKSPSHTQESH